MKKKKILLPLLTLFVLGSCQGGASSITSSDSSITDTSSSSVDELSEVQQIFAKIKKNNFTVDYTVKGYEGNTENHKYFYTDYAYQAGEGEGSTGIAQAEDGVYRYTVMANDEIESAAPLVSSSTGVRYDTIYDYAYGAQDMTLEDLPSEVDKDGYYTYTFDSDAHEANDVVFKAIFLQWSPASPYNPKEVKFRIINSSLYIHAVLNIFDGAGEDNIKTIEADVIVYDIGYTDIPEIKAYQASGKGAKDPLDLRFYKVMNEYFACGDNYSLEIDGTHVPHSSFYLTEKCTPEGYLTENSGYEYGAVVSQGYVNQFDIKDDKLVIRDTPQQDESTFYTSIFGEIRTSFSSLDFSMLSGYKSDEDENSYIINDSQFVYYFSSIIHVTLSDDMNADSITFTILDEETNTMQARLDLYETATNEDLGYLTATFSNPGTTSIPYIEEYLSMGKDPTNQDKAELSRMLDKFKGHNYSMDTMTSIGMAKSYYTPDYFLQVPYSSTYKNTNTGFLKDGDAIYSFSVTYSTSTYLPTAITVNTTTDYASEYGTTLPGVGTRFGDSDYVDYTSTFSDDLYDLDSYSVQTMYGQTSWMTSNTTLAIDFFHYLYGSSTTLLAQGFGVMVDEDANKLSLLAYGSTSTNSSYGYFNLTYYDIGTTSYEAVETLIADWKASRA